MIRKYNYGHTNEVREFNVVFVIVTMKKMHLTRPKYRTYVLNELSPFTDSFFIIQFFRCCCRL